MRKYSGYEPFKAKFQPYREDDLRVEVKKFIGRILEFQYAWTMDEDEQFPGEIAYMCNEPGFYYWVPERDIIKIKIQAVK